MLPKSQRLTKEDFKGLRPKVFFRGELFDIGYIPGETKKFACVIAKKTLSKAVDRNLIKRRIMECLQEVNPSKPYSFVIYPKKISLSTSYQQLHKEIIKAFATLR